MLRKKDNIAGLNGFYQNNKFKFSISNRSPYLCLPNFRFKKQIMANHSATKKDTRQAATRRERNKYYGKTTRNAIRELKAVSDVNVYGEKLPDVVSMIDKLAKRGVIHKNKAANLKSKLAKKKA